MKKHTTLISAVLTALLVLSSCGGNEAGIGTETLDQTETEKETGKMTETEKISETEEQIVPDLVFGNKNWKLTFDDEFDGESIDNKKWSQIPDWDRGSYIWMPEAARVEDGNLILSVHEGKDGKYFTGGIRTINKFSQAYGYYEVRCKLPTAAGINDAFWLMGGNMSDASVKGAKDGSEIDILETNGFALDRIQHALHWDGYGDDHEQVFQSVDGLNLYDGEYHTFGLLWEKTKYRFYVDGKLTWTEAKGGVCTVPLYLKLTVAVGGWVGDVDPGIVPIDAMIVDYVRVYKEI